MAHGCQHLFIGLNKNFHGVGSLLIHQRINFSTLLSGGTVHNLHPLLGIILQHIGIHRSDQLYIILFTVKGLFPSGLSQNPVNPQTALSKQILLLYTTSPVISSHIFPPEPYCNNKNKHGQVYGS